MDAALAEDLKRRFRRPLPVTRATMPGRDLRVIHDAARTPPDLGGAVLLLGNFDGFHRGHQALLRCANGAARGRPVGAMSVEPHPRSLFGDGAGFRLTDAATKREVLRRFGLDFVYSPRFDRGFAGQSPTAFAEDILARGLGVAHVVCGADFRFGCRRAGDVATLRALGAASGFGVSVIPPVLVDGMCCSSSLVRARLAAGDVAGVERALGYRWFFDATVASAGGSHAALALAPETAPIAPGFYRVLAGQGAFAAPARLAVPRDAGEPPRLRSCRSYRDGDRVRLTLVG